MHARENNRKFSFKLWQNCSMFKTAMESKCGNVKWNVEIEVKSFPKKVILNSEMR